VLARRASSDGASSDAARDDRSLVTDGTHLVGTLAEADALTVGLFPFDTRPEPAGSATVDLGLYGPLHDLVLSGVVTSPSLRRTAAAAQGPSVNLTPSAAPTSTAGTTDTVVVVSRSRDEEISALKEQLAKSKEELAKVSAELERIKKRLANPSN